MSKATRERQIRFMRGFSHDALAKAVTDAFFRYGADWLTDEQLAGIVSDQVSEWRSTQRMNRRNRALAAKKQAEKLQYLRHVAGELSKTMQCNCDLDNWEPERSTGHSVVCRIHKAAKSRAADSAWLLGEKTS